jgi:hypothetical protein
MRVARIFEMVALGCTYAHVAKKFGVTSGHIFAVLSGKAWSHVMPPKKLLPKLPDCCARRHFSLDKSPDIATSRRLR